MSRFFAKQAVVVAAVMLALGFASRVQAQRNDAKDRADDHAKESREASDPAGQSANAANVDRMVADQLLGMSQGEIDLANFALKHSQNEQIRKFAEMMIQDHTNLNNQLQRYASPAMRRTDARAGQLPDSRTEQSAAPTAQADTSAKAQDRSPLTSTQNQTDQNERNDAKSAVHVQICQDVGNQIGERIQKELGQYQGSDFDRAYVGQQFWGHVVFIATARGVEKHVSADLRPIVDQGAQTAEKHLAECRRLIRELSANVAQSNQGNEATPRR